MTFCSFLLSFRNHMEEKILNPVRKPELPSQNKEKEISENRFSNGVKLTSAVYRAADFFPEADPLKNRVKERALTIMEKLNDEKNVRQVLSDVEILLGYLKIAESQGWLKPINFAIISNEYEKIAGEHKKAQISPKPVLSKDKSEKINSQDFFISERQKKILEFLQKNERAQVMDLQAVLPNITKRTIRRDLDELLGAGKIVRQGEFNQVVYKIPGIGSLDNVLS